MEPKTETYQYRIHLETPLGIKQGKFTLSATGEQLEGTVELLGHQQGRTGRLQPDGSCVFSGQFKTLRSVFDYTAIGHFDEAGITFDLSSPPMASCTHRESGWTGNLPCFPGTQNFSQKSA